MYFPQSSEVADCLVLVKTTLEQQTILNVIIVVDLSIYVVVGTSIALRLSLYFHVQGNSLKENTTIIHAKITRRVPPSALI